MLLEGDHTSTPEELVESLIGRRNDYGGTNFDIAIRTATNVLERQWNAQRYIHSLYAERKLVTH